MKKYRLKKHAYINWIVVLIFLMIALICVNIGYSLWSTKLNIFGKVTLDLNLPHLEVTLLKNSDEAYVALPENSGFTLVRDEYSDNTLTTTVRSNNLEEMQERFKISFSMKNTSKTDELYIDGKINLVEQSSNGAISNISTNLSKGIIENGQVDTFNFFADVDKTAIDSSAYYKYEITYTSNNIKKNFYYVINILPAE